MDIAELPPWAQLAATGLTTLVVGIGGGITILRNRVKSEPPPAPTLPPPPEPEHFDPDELLGAVAVVRFFADVSELASNAKLQTEALRNLSAVGTLIGERLEDGYEELRVFKAVQEALDRERRSRHSGPPAAGWGA